MTNIQTDVMLAKIKARSLSFGWDGVYMGWEWE